MTLTLNFEYNLIGKKFHLYERGGGRYITRDCNGKIRMNLAPNDELKMLYPVAIVKYNGDTKSTFKKAIDKFLKTFGDIGVEFNFNAQNIRGTNYFKGKAKPSGRGTPKKALESMSFED
jgi:hypothetical protein